MKKKFVCTRANKSGWLRQPLTGVNSQTLYKRRKMYTIAVVDDEQQHINKILSFLNRYFDENGSEGKQFTPLVYHDGKELLENYEPKFDIIFLDVEMDGVDGMNAARIIREHDEKTAIIFITRVANYAVSGYEVNALDFMVKPIDYFQFSIKLKKALRYVELNREKLIKIENNGDVRWLNASQIRYLEIQNHSLIFHLEGEELKTWGSLKNIAEQLENQGFAYCNRCYLVNLRYVTGIVKNDCLVGGDVLAVSKYKRRDFMAELARFYSHKGN